LATWRLALIRQPFVFNLRAQPNCHIATLTQAFIVLPPVGDLVPFLVKLMPTRRVEFMPHRVLPVGKGIYGQTETPVSMQQRLTVPSGDLFYGFEQNIKYTKLRDTIQNCATHQVERQTSRLAPVGSMSVYDGYDIDGNDLTTRGIKGITFEQCQRECLAYQDCKAVSYVVSSQWCWPKSGITSTTQRDGVVSAIGN
jgi:hypothetical protein